MKPYGVKRLPNLDFPDKADIKYFGISSTDRCSKADRGKNVMRRFWKKKARNENKNLTNEYFCGSIV